MKASPCSLWHEHSRVTSGWESGLMEWQGKMSVAWESDHATLADFLDFLYVWFPMYITQRRHPIWPLGSYCSISVLGTIHLIFYFAPGSSSTNASLSKMWGTFAIKYNMRTNSWFCFGTAGSWADPFSRKRVFKVIREGTHIISKVRG